VKVDSSLLQQCWFLVGPTATGKTEAALLLAERLRGEIVALDSMSLYRGMDLGTAKPTRAQRARVPHHLIDILQPHEEFTVSDYVCRANAACCEILERGRSPLFVGGTGLYLRAMLRGVFDAPQKDEVFRAQLQSRVEVEGHEWLHRQLQCVDPAAAARLHPNDTRRLIRALEVAHLTGQPASAQQRELPLPPDRRPRHVYWLSPPRMWLHERINRRVVQMIEAGWVDEVRRLLDGDRPLSRTARQAVGYQELIAHLRGEMSLAEAVERIQIRTRQFAKRQHTWFRHLEECRAVPMTGTETPALLADRVLSLAHV
jgi:tRNA dimethylallyltransferase